MDYINHLYGRSDKKIKEIADGTIYEYKKNDKEKYVVTEYELFKGVKVFYNDIHIGEITNRVSNDNLSGKRYEINHCREGRFECVLKDGTITYMEAGDFAINLISNRAIESVFPISHYHGLTFYIIPSEFDEELLFLEKMFGLKYNDILESLCSENTLFIKRATPEIQHIFFEMYRVPNDIIISYLKVKFQELFLYLTTVDKNIAYDERAYFTKSNVDVMKKIHEYILDKYYETNTYEELSLLFNVGTTTMKNCYKSIYGESISDSIRKKRLETAANLLKNAKISVTDIAIKIGYADHSKFSKAFKKMYNITPSEYRKISNGAQDV
ncbi:MAG: AraC family transcriptional regulator [Peptostreptococcus sp.]|uniref:helix-turn-helix domain-containing protein n=1 Tax=Peptostreptococcus sp. TaxID=1262 RepID=UPI002FCC2E23